jgi:hypothetical protein
MDEALLHTIFESHSWPVRTTPPVARFLSAQKRRHFLRKAETLLACIQLALQLAELIGRGDGFSSPVGGHKFGESIFRFSG